MKGGGWHFGVGTGIEFGGGYANDGSKNFKVSVFTDHYSSNEHHRLVWVCITREKTMKN